MRLFSLLLITACSTEDFSEDPGTNAFPVTGDLTGIVVDESQQPISSALVKINEHTTISNEQGVFRFVDVEALSTGTIVTITKPGYYKGIKFINFHSDQNSILKVQLVSNNIVASFQSSEEVTINVNGAQLYLPDNITTRIDGSHYNGIVNVRAHYYAPTDTDIIENMPGDLRGISANGSAVQLTTYGMMAVELSDVSGETLALKGGMMATLTFPLPKDSNALEQIPYVVYG